MVEDIQKMIVVPIGGSEHVLETLDYINLFFGTDSKVTIFHSKRNLSCFIPGAIVEEFPEFQKHWLRKAGKEIAPFMQRAKDALLAAGLQDEQIAMKVIDGSHNAAADILKEAQGNKVGSFFLGPRGYSNVKDYSMGSVTRTVLNQAEDAAVCIVP